MSAVAMVPLRDLGEWSGGNTPSKANPAYWTNGTVPWVSPKDMKVDEITTSEDRISELALTDRRVSLVPEGSVLLVTRSGILAHTLPVAVTKLPVTINQDLKALIPKSGVSPEYVAHAVRGASRRILDECSKHGTTVASIETNKLLDFEIPLVDIDEQCCIVAEIEKQFSRLDEAVANLKLVKAKLRRYKAAVLKAAVEGRLLTTEAELARTQGSSYQSAEQLLKAIVPVDTLRKRAGRLWGSGHVPELTTEEFEAIPEGWKWAKVRDLGYSPEDAVQVGPMSMRSADFVDSGVPVLNVGCVHWGIFDESKLDHLTEEKAEQFARYRIKSGDVLFTRSGTVGRCAVARGHQSNWLMTFHLLRARPNPNICIPEFLQFVFQGAPHIRRQTRAASIGSTRAGFNTNLLANLDVPLPPLEEQRRIVAEVGRRLSVLGKLESEITVNQQRTAQMRQSILSIVFPRAHPT